MALPLTLDAAVPAGADSPAQGDDELRGIKQYLIDVYGAPSASAVTAGAFAVSTGGVATVSQTPFNVPTLMWGGASQILQIESRYSSLDLAVNGASIMSVTATGMRWQTRYAEFASGLTGVLGTIGSQPVIFRTNSLDWWQVDPSGMLRPVPSVVDIGVSGGPNPRNLYLASNLVVGGQIQAGAAPRVVTTPTGMLDARELTLPSEVRGDVLMRGASAWGRLAPGTSGYFLQTRAGGADAAWALGPLEAGQLRIDSEAQGDVLYRASSAWTRLAAGASGRMLQTRGTDGAPGWVAGQPGVAEGDNPSWSGQHTWTYAGVLAMSDVGVKVGLGTSSPTMMLDVRGNIIGASQVYMGAGAAANPAAAFRNDPDTGWYNPAANELGWVTGGAERARLDGSGQLGLGITTPTQLLHVHGRGYVGSHLSVVGQIRAGTGDVVLTTAGGLLDAAQLSLSNEARGDLLMRGASVWSGIAAGTSGYFLQGRGAAADVAWAVGPVQVAQLLLPGEAQGHVVFRGSSAWTGLAAGASGRYLQALGASADVQWNSLHGANNSWTGVNDFAKAYSRIYDAGTGSLTWTPDANNGNVQKRTANASGTLSVPTNPVAGMTIILVLVQDGTGSRVITWGAGWHFPGGTEGVLSTAANAIDVLSGVYDGTNWLVALSKDHKA